MKYVGPDVPKTAPATQNPEEPNVGCIVIAMEPKQVTPAEGSWIGADILAVFIPTNDADSLGYNAAEAIVDASVTTSPQAYLRLTACLRKAFLEKDIEADEKDS